MHRQNGPHHHHHHHHPYSRRFKHHLPVISDRDVLLFQVVLFLLPRVAGMLPQRDTDGMSTAAPIDVEDSSSDDDSWIF